jgi:hypothetical protein
MSDFSLYENRTAKFFRVPPTQTLESSSIRSQMAIGDIGQENETFFEICASGVRKLSIHDLVIDKCHDVDVNWFQFYAVVIKENSHVIIRVDSYSKTVAAHFSGILTEKNSDFMRRLGRFSFSFDNGKLVLINFHLSRIEPPRDLGGTTKTSVTICPKSGIVLTTAEQFAKITATYKYFMTHKTSFEVAIEYDTGGDDLLHISSFATFLKRGKKVFFTGEESDETKECSWSVWDLHHVMPHRVTKECSWSVWDLHHVMPHRVTGKNAVTIVLLGPYREAEKARDLLTNNWRKVFADFVTNVRVVRDASPRDNAWAIRNDTDWRPYPLLGFRPLVGGYFHWHTYHQRALDYSLILLEFFPPYIVLELLKWISRFLRLKSFEFLVDKYFDQFSDYEVLGTIQNAHTSLKRLWERRRRVHKTPRTLGAK